MKILLLENHSYFARAVVKEFLSEHDVTVLPSIAEAKEILESSEFDLFMSDYDLDDGKGDEFVAHLRLTGSNQPVIAISSHERGNQVLLAAGANIVCSKMEFRKISEVLSEVQT